MPGRLNRAICTQYRTRIRYMFILKPFVLSLEFVRDGKMGRVQFSVSKHPMSASCTRKKLGAAAAGCVYSWRRRHPPAPAVAADSDNAAIPPAHRPAAALILPGFLNSSAQYECSLLPALRALGYATEVVPMTTADW